MFITCVNALLWVVASYSVVVILNLASLVSIVRNRSTKQTEKKVEACDTISSRIVEHTLMFLLFLFFLRYPIVLVLEKNLLIVFSFGTVMHLGYGTNYAAFRCLNEYFWQCVVAEMLSRYLCMGIAAYVLYILLFYDARPKKVLQRTVLFAPVAYGAQRMLLDAEHIFIRSFFMLPNNDYITHTVAQTDSIYAGIFLAQYKHTAQILEHICGGN